MKIIFLHWSENHYRWKIIFHHLPYQTTENWKTFSRKIIFPLTKHYLREKKLPVLKNLLIFRGRLVQVV